MAKRGSFLFSFEQTGSYGPLKGGAGPVGFHVLSAKGNFYQLKTFLSLPKSCQLKQNGIQMENLSGPS